MEPTEFTVTVRAAKVGWELAQGARLTMQDVMRMTGLEYRGALALMHRVSEGLPILYHCGHWVSVATATADAELPPGIY